MNILYYKLGFGAVRDHNSMLIHIFKVKYLWGVGEFLAFAAPNKMYI